MTKAKTANRWLILVAGFLFNFCISGTSAFSIFVNPVMQATGWSQGSVTIAYTIYNIMVCVMGIVVGTMLGKISVRALIYTGSILFGLGWIVTGFASSVWMMYLGFGFISGAGGGCLYNFSVTNTTKWFPDKRGFVSGLLLGGAAIGPVFCAPVANAVLASGGVFNAYKIMGIIYLSIMLLAGWMVHTPPEGYIPEGWTPPQSAASTLFSEGVNWRGMLKTPTFWMLYLLFVLACTPTMMMLGCVAKIGQEQAGMSAAQAALSVSLLAIFNFCGRLLFGMVSDKLGRYKTLLIALCINFAAILGLSQMKTAVPFMFVMCLISMCGSALLVMFPPITSEQFGAKHVGLNYSIIFSAYSITGLIGPQIASLFKEKTGAYTGALIVAAIGTALAVLLLLATMKRSKRA